MVNKPEALCRLDALRKIESERRRSLLEIYTRHQRAVVLQRSQSHHCILPKVASDNDTAGCSSDASSRSDTSSSIDLARSANTSTESLGTVNNLPRRAELPTYSYIPRRYQADAVHSTLQGCTIVSGLPQVLYAHLYSGYIFECHVSENGKNDPICHTALFNDMNRIR